jgi:hypothetical protein
MYRKNHYGQRFLNPAKIFSSTNSGRVTEQEARKIIAVPYQSVDLG